jgi:hypothetical protein
MNKEDKYLGWLLTHWFGVLLTVLLVAGCATAAHKAARKTLPPAPAVAQPTAMARPMAVGTITKRPVITTNVSFVPTTMTLAWSLNNWTNPQQMAYYKQTGNSPKLQSSTNLLSGKWVDVTNALMTTRVTVPKAFYRISL